MSVRERCQECGVDTDDVNDGLCDDCYADETGDDCWGDDDG